MYEQAAAFRAKKVTCMLKAAMNDPIIQLTRVAANPAAVVKLVTAK